ncbi:hypothetical protein FRAHR75_1800002 [Frankia sp. Hr75.2]|nr:hypothetical protein FRAHR75_1800002 [Frankia sp. Hr75.2]
MSTVKHRPTVRTLVREMQVATLENPARGVGSQTLLIGRVHRTCSRRLRLDRSGPPYIPWLPRTRHPGAVCPVDADFLHAQVVRGTTKPITPWGRSSRWSMDLP